MARREGDYFFILGRESVDSMLLELSKVTHLC